MNEKMDREQFEEFERRERELWRKIMISDAVVTSLILVIVAVVIFGVCFFF